MARDLNADQIALLQSPFIDGRILVDIFLDEGTYSYCDDIVDLIAPDGTTYIGAAVLGASVDIVSSKPFAAESITITCDGVRMSQSGFVDPGQLFRDILSYNLTQRRFNVSAAFKFPQSTAITLVVPLYAGKINNARVVDAQINFNDVVTSGTSAGTQASTLQIMIDSLATRYQWVVGRTRSHNDQQQIDPGDTFFVYVGDSIANERAIYWGENAPQGLVTSLGSNVLSGVSIGSGAGFGGGGGGGRNGSQLV